MRFFDGLKEERERGASPFSLKEASFIYKKIIKIKKQRTTAITATQAYRLYGNTGNNYLTNFIQKVTAFCRLLAR